MNSKFLSMLSVAIVGAGMVMAFHTVSAQEAAAPAAEPATAPAVAEPAAKAPDTKPAVTSALELRKTGIVSVAKDASGKVTNMKLIVNSYDIPLDEGSKPLEAMALLGLGFRRISMSPAAIGPVKMMVRSLDAARLAAYMDGLYGLPDRTVRDRLADFASAHGVTV